MAEPAKLNEPATPNKAPRPRRTLRQEIARRAKISAVAFVVYVLSIGPMYWPYYNSKFNLGHPIIAAIYEPLYILCQWIPPLSWLVDNYILLWIT